MIKLLYSDAQWGALKICGNKYVSSKSLIRVLMTRRGGHKLSE